MTMSFAERRVLVLRLPPKGENFQYRLAELPDDEAQRLEQRLTAGSPVPDIGAPFGDLLTLPEVMVRLKNENFRVLDYPTCASLAK